MNDHAPVLHLLVGPNGAGKSTFQARLLSEAARGLPFVNADEIAATQWPTGTSDRTYDQDRAYEAAALAAQQRAQLIADRRSFVAETVFSHESKVQFVRDVCEAGYLVHLYVMVIPAVLAVARVAERVLDGGHTVPEAKTVARYERLWAHVLAARPHAVETIFYDNSRADRPFRRIATYDHETLIGSAAWPAWAPDILKSS